MDETGFFLFILQPSSFNPAHARAARVQLKRLSEGAFNITSQWSRLESSCSSRDAP